MSLHFLIDGYNVIKQSEFLKTKCSLRLTRDCLIKMIHARHLGGSKNNKFTIVFDGKISHSPYLVQDKDPIRIIFSKEESADEIIKKIVSDSDNPKQIVVVTDDKAVMFFTRSLGANIISVHEFLSKKRNKSDSKQGQRKKIKPESSKIELTYQQQETINQELRKIWE